VPYQPHPGYRSRRRPGAAETPRKRFAGAAAVLVVVASLMVGPWMVFGRQPVVMVAGGAMALLAVIAFLLAVRRMTDHWKE
jgi:cobalamin biosynthesis protein CobD/CbiB